MTRASRSRRQSRHATATSPTRRTRRVTLAWAVLLIALCGVTASARSCQGTLREALRNVGQDADADATDRGVTTTTAPPPTGEAFGTGVVTWIYDGDTVQVRVDGIDEKVRLIGIDAPETGGPYTTVECFGHESTAFAKEQLNNQRVRLDLDPSQDKRDRFGRLLAYVWLEDGTFVNELMIAEGYAREYTYDKPYRYQDRFRDAEAQAREREVGLWAPGVCGKSTSP
jgi:micrococcal nuclease